jgi:hypothetical protein
MLLPVGRPRDRANEENPLGEFTVDFVINKVLGIAALCE